jgi:hypothetical protein
MKATKEQVEKAIRVNANFLKVNITEIEVMENENSFEIRLCDDNSSLVNDYIMKDNVISEKDLDAQIFKIVDKYMPLI